MSQKRLVINISATIDNVEDAKKCVEDISVIAESFFSGAQIYAQILEMLTPCCGGKKPNE